MNPDEISLQSNTSENARSSMTVSDNASEVSQEIKSNFDDDVMKMFLAIKNMPSDENLFLIKKKNEWQWKKASLYTTESRVKLAIEQVLSSIWEALLSKKLYIELDKETVSCMTLSKLLFSRAVPAFFLSKNYALLNRWTICLLEDKFGQLRKKITERLIFLSKVEKELLILFNFLQKKQQIKVNKLVKKYNIKNNTLLNLTYSQIQQIIATLGYEKAYEQVGDHEVFMVKLRDLLFNPEEVFGYNSVVFEPFRRFFTWTQVHYRTYERFINELFKSDPDEKSAVVEYFIRGSRNLHEMRRDPQYKDKTPESLVYITEDERKEALYHWTNMRYEKAIQICSERYKRIVTIPNQGFDTMLQQLITFSRKALSPSICLEEQGSATLDNVKEIQRLAQLVSDEAVDATIGD